MSDVVVADAEFARQAQRVNDCAKLLESYLVYVGACLEELHTSGAIRSATTLAALKKDRKAVDGMAAEAYQAVANVVALTNEYVCDMDAIDVFDE